MAFAFVPFDHVAAVSDKMQRRHVDTVQNIQLLHEKTQNLS